MKPLSQESDGLSVVLKAGSPDQQHLHDRELVGNVDPQASPQTRLTESETLGVGPAIYLCAETAH